MLKVNTRHQIVHVKPTTPPWVRESAVWEIESESDRGELFTSGNSNVEALVNYVAFFSRVAFIDNYFLIT